MEAQWASSLDKQGWSSSTAAIIKNCLAPSTIAIYNRHINKLREFCFEQNINFPPSGTSVIADFLFSVANRSDRPRSVLTTIIAALNYLYRVLDIKNPCDDNIYMLQTALVKSFTRIARTTVNILPREPFNVLFLNWPSDNELTIKRLRIKVITLLAFTFMLRPSDIAPKSVNTDCYGVEQRLQFSTNQMEFLEDGGLKITFFGIKNDTHRDGFKVTIPPVSVSKLNPATCLKTYIERTDNIRPKDTKPVFVTNKRPYRGLAASSVAKILEEAIALAGLDRRLYSAKSFRPSGATRAIESGCDPDRARRIGRWKTPSVFFDHYVYDKPAVEYSDNIIL